MIWIFPTVSIVGAIIGTGGVAIWKASKWVSEFSSRMVSLEQKLDTYTRKVNGQLEVLRDTGQDHAARITSLERHRR